MHKVHILSPEIISKIAAGEVIERPASVLKELVENSLDAAADAIEIRLEDAGKKLIEVKDNGHGIAHEDLKTIFSRHATSKIASMDDLFAIRSLGFRGEALYSIAAISHVSVHSRSETQDSGWSLHLRGGEDFHMRPCSFNAHGTEISVKELFFNTPARKKFLKSNTAEMHQVLNTLIPYALLHNEVRFSLVHEEKTLLDVAPASDLTKRMAEVLNLDPKHLLETQKSFPDRRLSVHLILGDINIKRTRRDLQFIFVNGRPVQNKTIAFHINQTYRLIMPPDLYPCFAAYINVPPQEVDVNIHPTKREVKIKDEREICAVLRSLCEQTLMSSGPAKQAASGFQGPSVYREIEAPVPLDGQEGFFSSEDYAYPRSSDGQGSRGFFIPENDLFAAKGEDLRSRLAASRYIGGFMNKFLLFEMNRSLFVVDQHAAAERITYERLIRQMEKGAVEVQNLLSPILVKLTPQELLVWEEAKDQLNILGLSVTQWDEETVAVHAHPLFLKDIARTIQNLLAGENLAKCDHDAMARRACRSSVMAGDKLTPEEAEHFREQLLKCLDPFTCPHGRPTVIELTEDFLDKQFLRT